MTAIATALPGDHVVATVTVVRNIDVEMITSVLCTAIEGGIGYWSYAEQIVQEDVPESIDSIGFRYVSYVLDIEDKGEGTEFDPEKFCGEWINVHKARVTYDTIVGGIERILKGDPHEIHLHAGNCAIVANAIAENDPGMIDADAADWIVQCGLFGEVVFG